MAKFDLFRRLLGGGERRQRSPRILAPRGTRMLVVDDSPTIRAVLGKMLGQDGYSVLKADDGESVLAMARRERPALIFLDIVMPGMNGFAVLRALRRDPQTRAIPIVMISGNLQATEQFYVQRYGADDFMKKPFGRAEVFERIRQLVEAGRLAARDPSMEAARGADDLGTADPDVVPLGDAAPGDAAPEDAALDDAIPDVALPDADDPNMPPVSFSMPPSDDNDENPRS